MYNDNISYKAIPVQQGGMKEIVYDFHVPSKPGGSTHEHLDELSNLSDDELVDIIIEIIRIIKGRK